MKSPGFRPLFASQITDADQEISKIWNDEEDNEYVGFATDSNGKPKLHAFLNNGFLLNRDLGFDFRIVEIASDGNSFKFQWKLSNQKGFNPEASASLPSTYVSRASALHLQPENQASGLYVYFDVASSIDIQEMKAGDRYWLNVTYNDGTNFATSNGNTAHQLVECSARGVCDRVSGSCACVEGYTGDACQRTVCPNDCSGHGVCQSQKYFVLDGVAGTSISTNTYTAFDAESAYGCKCDPGFRGVDCAQRECPSGPDPMKGDGGEEGQDCSGRGTCDYATGICNCYKGYFGERCEELTNLK